MKLDGFPRNEKRRVQELDKVRRSGRAPPDLRRVRENANRKAREMITAQDAVPGALVELQEGRRVYCSLFVQC